MWKGKYSSDETLHGLREWLLELGYISRLIETANDSFLSVVINSHYSATVAHHSGKLLIVVLRETGHADGDERRIYAEDPSFKAELSDLMSLNHAEAFLRKWQKTQ